VSGQNETSKSKDMSWRVFEQSCHGIGKRTVREKWVRFSDWIKDTKVHSGDEELEIEKYGAENGAGFPA